MHSQTPEFKRESKLSNQMRLLKHASGLLTSVLGLINDLSRIPCFTEVFRSIVDKKNQIST